MRLWIVSDIEMKRDAARADRLVACAERLDAEACVIAGDADFPLQHSLLLAARIAKFMPVVYVPGNKDYYGSDPDSADAVGRMMAAGAQGHGISYLSDASAVIGGTRFIGATLWTDLRLGGREDAGERAYEAMTDFGAIRGWSVRRQLEKHARSRAFIEGELAKPHDGPTVVVTHHSPSPRSVQPRFAQDRAGLNACFHSDLGEILNGPDAPDLWVHGAINATVDYVEGGTRVLSNGWGYPGENDDFRLDLVVEGAPQMAPGP